MYCGEADEDFKLPLRSWLEKQINSGKYKGLEWIPSDDESKQFKLPWVKKNFPDWVEYYKIFRGWAEHRGRGEVDKLDDSKLKSNFRCALNKSVDFEEITSRSQLQKQTGNYKVYKILSPREVRERRRKRSRMQTKQEPNRDSNDFKSIDDKVGLDVLDSIDSSPSSIQSFTSSGRLISSDSSHQSYSASPFNPTTIDLAQFVDGEIQCEKIDIRGPESADFRSVPVITTPKKSAFPQTVWTPSDVPMEVRTPDDSEPYVKKSAYAESDSLSTRSLILQQLENAGFTKERLSLCQIVISYNGQKVFDGDLANMEKGYRIFYGDQLEQIRLLQMRNATDEKLADITLEGILLPAPSTLSHTMSAILNKTEFGVIIKYDPRTLQFYAKRLCQSQVFFYDPHDQLMNALPKKLEREEIVPLFSFEKYIMDYMQHCVSTGGAMALEAEIVLCVGIKPKSKVGLQTMKGLKIELIPEVLKCVTQNSREYANSLSLCFSNPTSIEHLLRHFHLDTPAVANRLVRC